MPGGLATPTFVVVVSSEADEGSRPGDPRRADRERYASGVLHSDDYTSLEPGYWVAYVGPFPGVAAAEAAKDELIADGYTAAYARCVGTAEECS